jgi:hypothetical protein
MRVLQVIALGCCALVAGCSEKSDKGAGPSPESGVTIQVVLGDLTDTVSVDGLPCDTIDGKVAVRLSAFVRSEFIKPYTDKDSVAHDTRGLYAYRLAGEDGFNPHDDRGYDDNVWEHLDLGYYLIDDDRAIFPDENIDLPGAFNVKSLRTIRVFRKIDVVTDTATAFIEIDDLPVVQVQNLAGEPENAVGLWRCVDAYVSDLTAHGFRLRTVDSFSTPTITWDQLQTGYWLLNTQRTIFTAPELNQGKYKVSVLESIDVTTP